MAAHGARSAAPAFPALSSSAGPTGSSSAADKALLNSYYRRLATRPNVTVAYDAKAEEYEFTGPRCDALVVVLADGRRVRVAADSVVCASGSFEGLTSTGCAATGPTRSTTTSFAAPLTTTGTCWPSSTTREPASAGEEKGFHAIALDARAPKFDGGIATRLDTIPFGIAVNKLGQRFYDEGEDIWPKRYAIWGRNIAASPTSSSSRSGTPR